MVKPDEGQEVQLSLVTGNTTQVRQLQKLMWACAHANRAGGCLGI